MRFRSPTETPIFLALTSGQTIVIGPELVEVPRHFHRLAVAHECLPEGMSEMPPEDPSIEDTKAGLILAAVKEMMAKPQPGDFASDGKPDARRLSAKVGFTVMRQERDTAWLAAGE